MKKKIWCLAVTLIVLVTFPITLWSVVASLGQLPSESFMVDFENLEAGTYYDGQVIQDAIGVPLTLENISQTGNMINASIIEENDGNKYIRFVGTRSGDVVRSRYTLNTPLTIGKIETGFEFDPEPTGKGSWEFFRVTNTEGNRQNCIRWSNVIVKIEETYEGTVHESHPRRNKRNRYSIHCEISRMKVSDDWEVKVFDVAQETPILLYSGKVVASFGNITRIEPIFYYASAGGWPANFDNYYLKTTQYPQVIEDSECASLGSNVESFTVGFNAQLPNPEDSVMLVNVNDENAAPITTTTIYDDETGRLQIKPDSLLDYDTTYNVVFASGDVASYSFTTKSKPISIVSSSVSYSDGTNTLTEIPETGAFNATSSVTARASVPDKQLAVIPAAYNEAGEALKYGLSKQPLSTSVDTTITATLADLKGDNVADVKTIIWEYKEGVGYRPIK